MIKVTALTSSRHDPSTRFRVRQFISPLSELGVEVSEHYPLISKYRTEPLPLLTILTRLPGLLASRFCDITWLGRELVSGRSTLEPYAGKRRLFDVDDAIWLVYPNSFSEEIALGCDGVIAGNNFLAEHYRKLGARVWVVPTSVDTEVWRPAQRREKKVWTIGWTGTWSNLKYLYSVEEPLADFLVQHRESRLLIVCDRRPQFEKIPSDRWRFVQWSPETEVRPVQLMDAGLMPLADTEWTRGKCAFKMLSYMASGVPVVASPVGVNQEIFQQAAVGFPATTMDDWYKALDKLYGDREAATMMGMEGRRIVEEYYSVKNSAIMLARIFGEVAGN
jgi:glycosyltransferase involved in cell wall biosynthesis